MQPAQRKIVLIAGARPQFIKAAMLARRAADADIPRFELVLVHTGQHYDANMSELFIRELGLPQPQHRLGIGPASVPGQTAAILRRLELVLESEQPAAVVVLGDTTSTLASALCAVQLGFPLVHVEAGERVYRRRRMPEEINRVATDHLAHLCLTATRQAQHNLLAEGIAPARIEHAGDLHYDLFVYATTRADRPLPSPADFDLEEGGYILATIHRAENTDDPERLTALLRVLDDAPLPVLLPMHPRTRQRMSRRRFAPHRSLRIVEPLGYYELIGLLRGCRRCVTDSGGVIREAWFARRPSVVPMQGAYWPDIINAGWSLVVGHDLDRLTAAIADFEPTGEYVEGVFGDGDAAGRILRAIDAMLATGDNDTIWQPPSAPALPSEPTQAPERPPRAHGAP